ncbi:serine hydrolase domain-containing protein [Domibacillus indicus]|uniref:serine hydrolase domain-containing protein n=1 Tax=Domibacillus indicus TaxID=1437523 RepID=UPI000698D49B|nr:serine hydrolase domain-containing protein [Domibacillus indicus]
MKTISKEAAKIHLDRYFSKLQRKKETAGIQVFVETDKLDFHYTYPSEKWNMPFHIASIGKLFTASLIMILSEKNDVSLQDSLLKYFTASELEGLFLIQGKDYAEKVTVEHLLTHTSGVADYFEDKVQFGESMMELIISNPDKKWSPSELIDFTRERQQAAGLPGQKFHYSDTGYILLGLLIEKVTGRPFHESLHQYIFQPLGMNDSYLLYCSEPFHPKKAFQPVWLNGTNITFNQSLSADWSGGGIISTPADLLSFYKGFRAGSLFQKEKVQMMEKSLSKFRKGIYYGTGMMEIHFEEFFFLLRGLPKVKGHIGILATHLFYDPSTDAYIVMNFGSNKQMVSSFKALIQIVSYLKKMQ